MPTYTYKYKMNPPYLSHCLRFSNWGNEFCEKHVFILDFRKKHVFDFIIL